MLTPEARKSNTTARKAKNVAANLARRDANRDEVLRLGLSPRESMHTKTSTTRDGKTREYTVTKVVRDSKLLRSDRRLVARMLSSRTAAAIHAAAQHMPVIAESMRDIGNAGSKASAAIAELRVATGPAEQ